MSLSYYIISGITQLIFCRFIACQQVLTLPGTEGRHAILADAAFWDDLSSLAYDQIIGVRISLARFAGLLHGTFQLDGRN